VKDESFNPTGTFKARGQAAAVARAKELGAKALVIPTAGNAGGAMAAYASRAGLTSRIYMPADTPRANIAECQALGAEVVLVEGLISDAARLVGEQVRQGGWFDLSTFKEPYRLEGKKVMGFELAEALGWKLPDVIVYPAGGGMGLVGIWKAFEELEELGWLEPGAKPRMVAVQAAGCAPVVQAFEAGEESNTFWENAHTLAAGLRVPRSYGDRLMMATLYQSKGAALAVSDEQILTAQAQLGRLEGIFAAPEGAATAAALPLLLERGWLMPDEQVVLLNTGTGLKYLDVVPPPDRSTGRDYQ
jgi:threonine synthase